MSILTIFIHSCGNTHEITDHSHKSENSCMIDVEEPEIRWNQEVTYGNELERKV